MADYVSPLPFGTTWLMESADAALYIDRWIDTKLTLIQRAESRFLKALKKGPTVDSTSPEWMQQRGYPRTITAQATGGNTITFSGKFNGQNMTAALMKQVIRQYTVLQKRVAGVTYQVQISDSDFTDLAVSAVAYGNTSWANDNAPIEYRIISQPASDDREFAHPTFLPRAMLKTFTQVFERDFNINLTEQKERQHLIKDPTEHQITMILRSIKDEQADVVFNGRPYWDVGTSAYLGMRSGTSRPTMPGVLWWIEYAQSQEANTAIWYDAGGEALTEDMINKVVSSLEQTEDADLGTGRWEGWTSYKVRPYINEFEDERRRTTRQEKTAGSRITNIETDRGLTLPVDDDVVIPDDIFFIAPMDTIEWGDFKDDPIRRSPIPSNSARILRWQIHGQNYGTKPDNPRWLGGIYNIAPHPSRA